MAARTGGMPDNVRRRRRGAAARHSIGIASWIAPLVLVFLPGNGALRVMGERVGLERDALLRDCLHFVRSVQSERETPDRWAVPGVAAGRVRTAPAEDATGGREWVTPRGRILLLRLGNGRWCACARSFRVTDATVSLTFTPTRIDNPFSCNWQAARGPRLN